MSLPLTQTLALAHTLEQGHSVRELLALLEAMVGRGGVDALHPRWRAGNLAMPRPLEARWLGPGLGLGSGLGLGYDSPEPYLLRL